MPDLRRRIGLVLVGAFGFSMSASYAYAEQAERDPFAELEAMDGAEMAELAGGASFNLGDVAVNLADQTAGISDTSMIGRFQNGRIANNAIEQLSGINSLMFNTGNNVNFLSSIQVNVFVQ